MGEDFGWWICGLGSEARESGCGVIGLEACLRLRLPCVVAASLYFLEGCAPLDDSSSAVLRRHKRWVHVHEPVPGVQ